MLRDGPKKHGRPPQPESVENAIISYNGLVEHPHNMPNISKNHQFVINQPCHKQVLQPLPRPERRSPVRTSRMLGRDLDCAHRCCGASFFQEMGCLDSKMMIWTIMLSVQRSKGSHQMTFLFNFSGAVLMSFLRRAHTLKKTMEPLEHREQLKLVTNTDAWNYHIHNPFKNNLQKPMFWTCVCQHLNRDIYYIFSIQTYTENDMST